MSAALVAREEFAKTALLRNIRDGRVGERNVTPWQRQLLASIVKTQTDLDHDLMMTIRRILDPVISRGDIDPFDTTIERIEPAHVDLPYAETPAVLAMRARKRALGR